MDKKSQSLECTISAESKSIESDNKKSKSKDSKINQKMFRSAQHDNSICHVESLDEESHKSQTKFKTPQPQADSTTRREFLKTSAKVGGAIGITSLSGFGIFGLSACDSNTQGANATQTTTNTNISQGEMMNLTDNAKATFEKLFGIAPHKSDLAQSDPEFFSNYVNFAFDEVIADSKLDLQERLLIILASLVAIPALSEYQTILKAALKNGISPVAIKEVIYQATPYVGMGKSIDFITATNEIFKAHNITLPLESQSTTTRENRQEKGLNTQRELFGEAIDKGNAAAPQDYKHIRRFLSANCFGDYYTRTGLELQFRELLTFVYILSMGGADSQVKAHVAGNIRIGNDRAKLIAVVTALVPYIGYPRSLNALNAIDEIAPLK